jgi:uncharacterized protein (TIGR04255 family)
VGSNPTPAAGRAERRVVEPKHAPRARGFQARHSTRKSIVVRCFRVRGRTGGARNVPMERWHPGASDSIRPASHAMSTPPNTPTVTFANPPVTEVAFSVTFEVSQPVIDEVTTLSEFWQTPLRETFPTAQRQPPLPPVVESFDLTPAQPIIQFFGDQPPFRYWFIEEGEVCLIQVQGDRLAFNWRKREPSQTYPRYSQLAPRFFDVFERFLNFASVPEGSGTWCELTYINTVPAASGSQMHGQLAKYLGDLVRDPERSFLPPIEDTTLQERFRITDDTGRPVGRIYVTATPALTSAGDPAYQINLTVRKLAPEGDIRSCVRDCFAEAHSLLVNSFVELTTHEAHVTWGLRHE